MRYLLKLLPAGAVFGAIVAAALFGGSMLLTEEEKIIRLPIAMIIEDDFGQNRIALSIFESIELNDAALDIRYMEKEPALDMVKNGELVAALFIPEGFVRDIMNGENSPATVTTGSRPGVEALLFRQAAEAGALLIKSSQCGVYAAYDAAFLSGIRQEQLDEVMDEINRRYVSLALTQNAMIENADVSGSAGLSMAEYLGASGVMLSLLLMGTAISGLFRRDNGEFYRCLFRKNVGGAWVALCKLCGIFVIQLVFAAILVFLFGAVFSIKANGITLVTLLPAVFTVAAFQMFLLYAVDSHMAGVMLQFCAGVFMLFMAGGIVPAELLPEGLTGAAQWLPITFALGQARSAIAGTDQALAGCIIWSFVLFLAGTGLINIKTRKA